MHRGWYVKPMRDRIIAAWHAASPHHAEGRAWYPNAWQWCADLASEQGYDTWQVAGALAALSPMRGWEDNLRLAELAVRAHKAGQHWTDVTLSFAANNWKAWAILDGDNPLDVLGGDKVRAFYRAIMGDDSAVCVDRWAYRIARPDRPYTTPTARQYARLADAYRLAAEALGQPPATVQAATWTHIRTVSGDA